MKSLPPNHDHSIPFPKDNYVISFQVIFQKYFNYSHSVIYSFCYSFKKHLLSTYYEQGTEDLVAERGFLKIILPS